MTPAELACDFERVAWERATQPPIANLERKIETMPTKCHAGGTLPQFSVSSRRWRWVSYLPPTAQASRRKERLVFRMFENSSLTPHVVSKQLSYVAQRLLHSRDDWPASCISQASVANRLKRNEPRPSLNQDSGRRQNEKEFWRSSGAIRRITGANGHGISTLKKA